MTAVPCTVGILTYNSGKTLRRALESVKDFDDIILCDGGSTDDTLAIANEFDCTVIRQDPRYQNEKGNLVDFAGARNQCLDAARYDWFFYIDSDEVATPELVEEILQIVDIAAPKHLVYNIAPRIVREGALIEHSSNYPGWQKRFFNRTTGARFRKKVHERIDFDAGRYPAGRLKGHWRYFMPAAHDQEKSKRYARMDADLYRDADAATAVRLVMNKIATIAKIALKAAYNYLRYGFRDSMPISSEYARAQYQAFLVWYLLRDRLVRRQPRP